MTGHGWDGVAAEWVEFVRSDRFFETNASSFLRLLPPPPLRVLDLGCGEGRFDRRLRESGYRVVGIDSSASLVALAAAADPKSEYHVADAAAVPLPDHSVELVVSFMALQDIEDLAGTCREARRALSRGGSFCFSVLHPLASADGSYLGSRAVQRPLFGREVTQYHRPLGAYLAALTEAGFLVSQLAEIPGRPGREIPMFLHVCAAR